jgi:hypothetical protein
MNCYECPDYFKCAQKMKDNILFFLNFPLYKNVSVKALQNYLSKEPTNVSSSKMELIFRVVQELQTTSTHFLPGDTLATGTILSKSILNNSKKMFSHNYL